MHTFNAVSLEDPTPVAHNFRNAQVRDFGAYLQDSWRAAPGVTVNAGVRWDGESAVNYAARRCSACTRGSPGSA